MKSYPLLLLWTSERHQSVPDGSWDLQTLLKSTGNGKYVRRYKRPFFFFSLNFLEKTTDA